MLRCKAREDRAAERTFNVREQREQKRNDADERFSLVFCNLCPRIPKRHNPVENRFPVF